MIELGEEEYIEIYLRAGGNRNWYGYPRGFAWQHEIYINRDAFFLGERDKRLLIEHEQGHLDGKGHTWFGVMSPWGLVRYLTAW